MDIILTHLGSRVPEYMVDCVRQIRRFVNGRIILYAPDHNGRPLGTLSNEVYFIKDIPLTNNWKKFIDPECMQAIGTEGFWRVTCERLFAVEAIMKDHLIEKALHLENDNLIYAKPDYNWLEKKCGKKIGLTRINDGMISAGIMYVGSVGGLEFVNKKINDLLETGMSNILKVTGEGMVNEMVLLGYIKKRNDSSIELLPTIPKENIEGFVYDCASWGQYVGGTNQTPGIPFSHDTHHIGLAINSGMLDLKWINGKPYAVDKSKNIEKPIFNLHIHSKELSKWTK